MKTLFSKSLNLIVLWSCLTSVVSCAQEGQTVNKEVSQKAESSWETHSTKFSGRFELATNFQQNKNALDLNGDGQSDYVYFLKSPSDKMVLPKSLQIALVWQQEKHSQNLGRHGIGVIHGNSDAAYVIYDSNEMSVLDTQAATESFVMKKSELASTEEPDLIKKAKGDVIVIPTEAGIDNYVYWDGAQYVLHEVFEMP